MVTVHKEHRRRTQVKPSLRHGDRDGQASAGKHRNAGESGQRSAREHVPPTSTGLRDFPVYLR